MNNQIEKQEKLQRNLFFLCIFFTFLVLLLNLIFGAIFSSENYHSYQQESELRKEEINHPNFYSALKVHLFCNSVLLVNKITIVVYIYFSHPNMAKAVTIVSLIVYLIWVISGIVFISGDGDKLKRINDSKEMYQSKCGPDINNAFCNWLRTYYNCFNMVIAALVTFPIFFGVATFFQKKVLTTISNTRKSVILNDSGIQNNISESYANNNQISLNNSNIEDNPQIKTIQQAGNTNQTELMHLTTKQQ